MKRKRRSLANRTAGWGIWSGSHWIRSSFFSANSCEAYLYVGAALFGSRARARNYLRLAKKSFPKAAIKRVFVTVKAAPEPVE